MTVLDEISLPIVLAPLAGGPSTPELAAAVSSAGGLGFVAGGYLSAAQLAERIERARSLSSGPIAANLFCPGDGPAPNDAYTPFVEQFAAWAAPRGLPVGEPRFSDDDWEAKLELLLREGLPAASFTFGCPDPRTVAALRDAGTEVWITVTTPDEAATAEAAGADALVVQGSEAGGHRGSFSDHPGLPVYGLLPLLSLVASRSTLPLVASGGLATGAAVAGALAAGARAAQIGTAFMLCPEAGTSDAQRAALKSRRETALTRAFTGRLARGIRNEFMEEHGSAAPVAYPEVHYLTAPLRRRGREEGNAEVLNLWAGEAHSLAREEPAGEVVRRLGSEAESALREAEARLRRPPESPDRLSALAVDWYEAWNAHDLDRVLSHYAERIVFSSPLIAILGFDPTGTVIGKARLSSYWGYALGRFPDLRFEPLGSFFGASSIALRYRTVQGLEAIEVMELGPDGLVIRSTAHYDRLPDGPGAERGG